MSDTQEAKQYNLGERTLKFAKRVIEYVNKLPKGLTNIEVGKQLARSACSIGANYIEAEESLSRKDFIMRIKISRKEAKETIYWLMLSKPKKPKRRTEVFNSRSDRTYKNFWFYFTKDKEYLEFDVWMLNLGF